MTHHIVYAGKDKIPIKACPKDCEICIEWNKKGQTWKVFEFCPVHCHLCKHAGYPEEFDIINMSVLVCIKCYDKYLRCIKYYRRYGYMNSESQITLNYMKLH